MSRWIHIKGWKLNAKTGKLVKTSGAKDVSARIRERHSKRVRVARRTPQ